MRYRRRSDPDRGLKKVLGPQVGQQGLHGRSGVFHTMHRVIHRRLWTTGLVGPLVRAYCHPTAGVGLRPEPGAGVLWVAGPTVLVTVWEKGLMGRGSRR
jgi:hypothetical protein